jgi:hypothetical protein
MTGAPMLPDGRVLAPWWHELTGPFRPRRWWFASLVLHRVEALVAESRPATIDPLHRALLRALAPTAPAGALGHLRLHQQLQHAAMRELCDAGLLHHGGAGLALTPTGVEALESNRSTRLHQCRRSFCFVDNGALACPPHFLHLDGALPAAPARPGPPFDPTHLRHAIEQSSEWKSRHRFPAEVTGLLGLAPHAVPGDWRRVVLDRPERHGFVLLEQPLPEGSRLLGFLANPAGGHLHADRPTFCLADDRNEVFPDLAAEPPPAAWQQAWERWCAGLPGADPALAASPARLTSGKLLVGVPEGLRPWLRDLPGNPLVESGCLLAGSGRLWSAAVIEVEKG